MKYTLMAAALLYYSVAAIGAVSPAETRFSRQLQTAIEVGQPVMLGEEDQTFLAVYTQAQGAEPRGGVVLLHDIGTHADWPSVIHPLRVTLPRHGWHTLSIQLPVFQSLEKADLEDTAREIHRRIGLAIEYFRSKRVFNLALIGYGYGGAMAATYLADPAIAGKAISTLVLVGVYNPRFPSVNQQTLQALEKISYPVLDVVGQRESDLSRAFAEQRRSAALTSAHDKYRQIFIIGADRSFSTAGKSLHSRILKWITTRAPSVQLRIQNNSKSEMSPTQSQQ